MNYVNARLNYLLASSVTWTLFATVAHCRRDVTEQFVANILPMDILVAQKQTISKQHNSEPREAEDIALSLNVTDVFETVANEKVSNLSAFQEQASQIQYTSDIIAFYDSRRSTRHMEGVPMILLIAISGIAIMLTFSIALVSTLYRRRRRLWVSSSKTYHSKDAFFAVEGESRAWDSLSFSNSIADLSTFRLQFQSLESLSDDSYINSLDEAISCKAASMMHKKSLRNTSPNVTNITVTSRLSLNDQ